MSRLFIHIPNNHFQIDDFICSIDEIRQVDKKYPKTHRFIELEYNTDASKRRYMKDEEDNIMRIDDKFQAILEKMIEKVGEYKTDILALREANTPNPTETSATINS